MSDLSGRVALVTGAASGIGREIARLLAREGCAVLLHYRQSEESARRLAQEIAAQGGWAQALPADLADPRQVEALAASALQARERLDFLIHNAATTTPTPVAVDQLEALELDDWDRILTVNLRSVFQLTRALAPALRDHRGAVVNVSSSAAQTAVGSSIPYAASKAALHNLTLSLSRALAPEVRVNAVAPGPVDTPWLDRLWPEQGAAVRRRLGRRTALGRLVQPEEVAQAVRSLLGLTAVTGQILTVDGGYPHPPL